MKEFLAGTELFGELGPEDLEDVAAEFSPVRLAGGETLFRQNDAADALYLVKSGRLRAAMKIAGAGERLVGEIVRGEVAGEMALLTEGTRSATVTAIRDSELLRLSKPAFDRLVERHPRTMMRLARRIIERGQQALHGAGKVKVPTTIALVPVGNDVALAAFAEKLREALSAFGSTILLDNAYVQREFGEGMIDRLDELETNHRFVIYAADPLPSNWSDLALRQADRVLLVGRGDRRPAGRADLLLAHGLTELVLVHPERLQGYTGTSAWLSALSVSRHHHVNMDSRSDFERLARFITGRAVGLVLGGGGARGFAHIGVLRAIEEAGIPIDLVGGTSMGSFIGAQYALGLDWRAMRDFNSRFWNKIKPFNDYTFPWISLVRGKRYAQTSREIFGDSQIEDLWLNYFPVASDLTNAQIKAPTQGSLSRWVGASMAIPGIVAPTFDNGDLYVDGGVLDNLPIDVMLSRGAGFIIAVDVTPREDLQVDPKLTGSPQGWKIWWSRMPWARAQLKIPTLFDILSRTTSLSSLQNIEAVKREVDLYLHPPTEEYGMLEFGCIDEIIELGYRHAVANLKNVPSLGVEARRPEAGAPAPPPEKRTRRGTLWAKAVAAALLLGFVWNRLPLWADLRLNRVGALPRVSRNAAVLSRSLAIADLHADSLLWGRSLLARHRRGQVDIPRLIEGGVALQVFGIVTQMPRGLSASNDGRSDWITWLALAQRWPLRTYSSYGERALYQARRLRDAEEQSNQTFVLIRSSEDLWNYLDRRRKNPRMTAGLLAVEGAQALEGSLDRMDEFYAAGVRMMSPTHFVDTEMGGSAHGKVKGGLTPLGRRWLAEMEKRKMIVDLAHASPATVADVLALAKRPVVVSHTGVKATCDNARNLSDDQLRAVAKHEGLVGIGYWPLAVCGTDADAVARAVKHTVDVAGVGHVGLGSDFDGAVRTPFDAAHPQVLVEALLRAGLSVDQIRRVMGRNALDFLAKNLP